MTTTTNEQNSATTANHSATPSRLQANLDNISKLRAERAGTNSKRTRKPSANPKRPANPANPDPCFRVPKGRKPPPPLNQRLTEKAMKDEDTLHFWIVFCAVNELRIARRQRVRRQTYKPRRKAILAVTAALFYSLNLTTMLCHTHCAKLAKDTGLTEYRVSEALSDLMRAGFIDKQAIRGADKRFLPLRIKVNVSLIKVFGIKDKHLETIRAQHAKYSKAENQKIPEIYAELATGLTEREKALPVAEQAARVAKRAHAPRQKPLGERKRKELLEYAALAEHELRIKKIGWHAPHLSSG